MLDDPLEIEIISKARQKNVRDHRRSREHFLNIYADFLEAVDFRDSWLLDMGPGQYDFGVLARERGAETLGLDHDPAVLELGAHKDFSVKEYKLQAISAVDFERPFNGLFCKFSWNAFWFHDDSARHHNAVMQLGEMLDDKGWGWVAPWNGVPKNAGLSATKIEDVLGVQNQAFKQIGFSGFDLGDRLARRYGVHGTVANNALFLRNLELPASVKKCPVL